MSKSPFFPLVKFTPEAQADMGKVIADMIVEQVAQGINADGLPLPPGVDLRNSGAMLASIEAKVGADGIEVACRAPYAVFVNNKYHFFGIASQNLPELYRRLQPIAAKGAYFYKVTP